MSIFIVLISLQASAQMKVTYEAGAQPKQDTFRVVFHNDKWAVAHKVKQGETLFLVSRRYHVPPAMVADMNKVSYQEGLSEDAMLYIPLGAYNQSTKEPANSFDHRALVYEVQKYDNLFRIAHMAGVSQRDIQGWNGMSDNYITEGKRLFVGWVLYDETLQPIVEDETPKEEVAATEVEDTRSVDEIAKSILNNSDTVIVIRKARDWHDTLPEMERKYMSQTSDEQMVMEEKGTAVFFEMKGKVSNSNTYYAFHNTAKLGTIIKVYNSGTGKTVFVKVLGPLPDTKQYYNSIIGISSGAKEELLVPEDRTWCELKYVPPL